MRRLYAAVAERLDPGEPKDPEALACHLRDVASHGADTGWNGFIYTQECAEFYEANKEDIWELLRESAEDEGIHPLAMVAQFGRGGMATDHNGFANLLAWFALEEVARAFVDAEEREKEEVEAQ